MSRRWRLRRRRNSRHRQRSKQNSKFERVSPNTAFEDEMARRRSRAIFLGRVVGWKWRVGIVLSTQSAKHRALDGARRHFFGDEWWVGSGGWGLCCPAQSAKHRALDGARRHFFGDEWWAGSGGWGLCCPPQSAKHRALDGVPAILFGGPSVIGCGRGRPHDSRRGRRRYIRRGRARLHKEDWQQFLSVRRRDPAGRRTQGS